MVTSERRQLYKPCSVEERGLLVGVMMEAGQGSH